MDDQTFHDLACLLVDVAEKFHFLSHFLQMFFAVTLTFMPVYLLLLIPYASYFITFTEHIFCPYRMPFSIFHFPNVLLMFAFMCLAKESTDFASKCFLLLCSAKYISFFFSFWFWVGQAKKFYSTLYGKQIAVKNMFLTTAQISIAYKQKFIFQQVGLDFILFSCHWTFCT